MSVLLSIKEKYADAILSGEKTIEVRKSFPKRPGCFMVFLYKTLDSKADPGMVVGMVTCTGYEPIEFDFDAKDFRVGIGNRPNYYVGETGNTEPIRGICITQEELLRYYGSWFPFVYKNGAMRKKREKKLYGWKLQHPVRFGKAVRLDEFVNEHGGKTIERAPQSWCNAIWRW